MEEVVIKMENLSLIKEMNLFHEVMEKNIAIREEIQDVDKIEVIIKLINEILINFLSLILISMGINYRLIIGKDKNVIIYLNYIKIVKDFVIEDFDLIVIVLRIKDKNDETIIYYNFY